LIGAIAAELLADARKILGAMDFAIVEAVVGTGDSIAQVASRFCGNGPARGTGGFAKP
jgi:uncharacterized MnhB-related membrane protein